MYPVLFQIGDTTISSFSVMLLLAFFGGYLVTRAELKRKGLDEGLADLFVIAYVVGGVVGAKILFLMQNVPLSDFLADPFRYLSSGLTFFGGLILALILLWIVIKWNKLNLWQAWDAMAPGLVLGYAIGRIGCLLVGDDYGVPSDLPWAMAFPEGSPPTFVTVHPTQIYETLIMTGVFLILWKIRKASKPHGWLTGIAFILMGLERFFVEFVRHTTPSFIPGLSMAQLMAVALLLIGAFRLIQIRGQKPAGFKS